MKQRGRKSAGAMTLVVDDRFQMPPAPPSELTDAQAAVWRDVVGSLPGGWVSRAAFPILVQLCRHVGRARLLERAVADFQMEWLAAPGGPERLNLLLGMAQRETASVISCSRQLRLGPQQREHPRTAGRQLDNVPTGPKPWDS